MKTAIPALLVALNLFLAALLYAKGQRAEVEGTAAEEIPVRTELIEEQHAAPAPLAIVQPEPETPYEAVYSARPAVLAANLRRIGCPEETVRDILVAEMKRRYRAQEESLRPKPADHVPWGWSAKTNERKLIERRQRAAAIAREKEAILRDALGYEVHVPMPLYAMTVSDRDFQKLVEKLPPEYRQAAYQTQDQYWTRVEQLREWTKDFWEPANVEQLELLKKERQQALGILLEAAGPGSIGQSR